MATGLLIGFGKRQAFPHEYIIWTVSLKWMRSIRHTDPPEILICFISLFIRLLIMRFCTYKSGWTEPNRINECILNNHIFIRSLSFSLAFFFWRKMIFFCRNGSQIQFSHFKCLYPLLSVQSILLTKFKLSRMNFTILWDAKKITEMDIPFNEIINSMCTPKTVMYDIISI